jgi:hypothetical protein
MLQCWAQLAGGVICVGWLLAPVVSYVGSHSLAAHAASCVLLCWQCNEQLPSPKASSGSGPSFETITMVAVVQAASSHSALRGGGP